MPLSSELIHELGSPVLHVTDELCPFGALGEDQARVGEYEALGLNAKSLARQVSPRGSGMRGVHRCFVMGVLEEAQFGLWISEIGRIRVSSTLPRSASVPAHP